MTVPTAASLYTQGFGSRPENVEIPTYQHRAPGASDVKWPVGKRWIDQSVDAEYSLARLSTSNGIVSAVWIPLGGGTSDLGSLTGDSGGAITPVAGNIDILGGPGLSVAGTAGTLTINLTGGGIAIDSFTPDAGTNPVVPSAAGLVTMAGTANQITTTGGLNSLTFSIPSAFTAPGSITSTTTITSGTGITSTTGNIVATAGAVNAGTTMTAGTGITATTGNIVASAGAVTAGTSVTATLGNITATNGNLVLTAAGNKMVRTSVASTTTAGANSIGTVTLVGGTATISTTAVTAGSLIQLSRMSVGATGANPLGMLSVGTITAGASFVINAWSATDATTLAATDVSSILWEIIN